MNPNCSVSNAYGICVKCEGRASWNVYSTSYKSAAVNLERPEREKGVLKENVTEDSEFEPSLEELGGKRECSA